LNGKKSLPRSRKFRERVTAVVACTGAIAVAVGFMMMAMAGPANADWGGIPNENSNKDNVGSSSQDNNGQSGEVHGNSDNGNGQGSENAHGNNPNANGNANNDGAGKKVDVCHATDSMTNPYVFINVSTNAVSHGHGHYMHKVEPNKIWKDSATWNGTFYAAGAPRPDFIGPYTDKDGTQVPGTSFTREWCEASPNQQTVTPSISLVDPCGTANDSASAVLPTGVNLVLKNGNVFTFAASPGYTLTPGTSQLTAVFTNNVACPTTPPPPPPPGPPTVGATDVCPNLAGMQTEIPGGYDKNCKKPEVQGTEAEKPPVKKPIAQPEVQGTAPVPTAVASGIGGNGPMNGSSPIDLLAQMLVGGGLALLMAAGWLQIGRQTRGVDQA